LKTKRAFYIAFGSPIIYYETASSIATFFLLAAFAVPAWSGISFWKLNIAYQCESLKRRNKETMTGMLEVKIFFAVVFIGNPFAPREYQT